MESMITGEKWIRSRAVVAREIAGETLLVPIRGKVGDLASIYSFNATGTLIWKSLDSPRTVSEIAGAVAGEYAVAVETAQKDVEQFLGEMKVAGLIEAAGSAAAAG